MDIIMKLAVTDTAHISILGDNMIKFNNYNKDVSN